MASKKELIVAIPPADEWKPENPDDIIFSNAKNLILAPVGKIFKLEDPNARVNYFMMNSKKSYNSDDLRNHCCDYINYFEKFYDTEKEYFTNMAYIKYLMDAYPAAYNQSNFITDINRYILQESIFNKVLKMVEDNYSLELSYKSANNPQLQYTNEHAKVLMAMSILMNLCIPLLTHFAYTRRIQDIDEYILDIYDYILYAPPFSGVDIPSKIYETAISNVTKNEKNNMVIWGKQPIRGKDAITHSMGAIKNIVINIVPKYTFDKSMVSLNYTSIQKSNKYQVTDIKFEYSYVMLSSSKRDGEDSSSEMDRYEANLTKVSEAMYLQSKFNCEYTMNQIEKMFGPFDQKEIDFYLERLKGQDGEIINGFQKQLIFNLFYKYFVDTNSINSINVVDYVKLMIAAKQMLSNSNMVFMPYVVSAKVDKIIGRKTLNKRELARMEMSQNFPLIVDKFKNDKVYKQILSTIATIITSTFHIIDYKEPDLDGRLLNIDSDMIIEECLLYILLI
jgi:hypothetical protein